MKLIRRPDCRRLSLGAAAQPADSDVCGGHDGASAQGDRDEDGCIPGQLLILLASAR